MDLRKNDIVKGTIVDLNDDGQGILKHNGQVVFCLNALPGEEVEGVIINTKSKIAILKPDKIENACKDRILPACPYFLKCGGCDLEHLSYKKQLEFKTNKVKSALKRNAHIDYNVSPCISLNEYRYRNKIALPISANGKIGLYRKNSHSTLEVEDCIITEAWNKTLISVINEYIEKSRISIYNETTKQGSLKHIVARNINNSILITLVLNDDDLTHKDILIDLLSRNFSRFGLNININKLHNNVILSDTWKHIYGLKELTANEEGITYPVSNASFYQVNNEIKNAIYLNVLSLIDSSSTVIDAYSGAGLLSAIISKKAKKCYGVEIVQEATENANKLKKLNHLTNLENINGDCTKVIPTLVKNLTGDIIVTLDPPRKGCDKKVLDAIVGALPNKIIYISCNPQTLARDLEIILSSNKYKLSLVQPYDMFPQTSHVETLLVVEKI